MAYGGQPAGSRAVLIGVSTYEHADFTAIPAARNSLKAMYSLLADPLLCGWPAEQITMIADPASAVDLVGQVADLAEAATGVLLLYYVGHGVLSPRGELCLTVTSTRPDRPKFTGLQWETLDEVLRDCPARTRLVILDCCFAGRAIEALAADNSHGLADITHVAGVYTLTATTRNRTAHVPPPGQQDTACTSFTGEFRDLIMSGIPGKPSLLTFGDIYPELLRRLRAKRLPEPGQRGTDTVLQFPFTANAATGLARQRYQERQERQVTFARINLGIMEALYGEKIDPDLAAQLTADPDRLARFIEDKDRHIRAIMDELSKKENPSGTNGPTVADPDHGAGPMR
jgi:hypothetical protein